MRNRRYLSIAVGLVAVGSLLPVSQWAAEAIVPASGADKTESAARFSSVPEIVLPDSALESRLITAKSAQLDAEREAREAAELAARQAAQREAARQSLAERAARERASRDAARTAAAAAAPGPVAAQAGAPGPLDDAFAKLRNCEAGGRYNANTGNGYYGAYQFSASTWRGLGFPGLPHEAPPQVQDEAARKLQARSGWGQWPACSRRIGVR